MEDGIAKNLSKVHERIEAAAARAGRDPKSVQLVAVTKTVPPERVAAAYRAGQEVFGENYVQEAAAKRDALSALGAAGARFHFIGRLQRNKSRDAAGLFELIQSVDRLELAHALSNAAQEKKSSQPVLVQVNISREQSKGGILPEDVLNSGAEIASLPSLELQGLMAIGSEYSPDLAQRSRDEFTELESLRVKLEQRIGRALPVLSAGMSSDYELAIECGATVVRVGSAIFGARN